MSDILESNKLIAEFMGYKPMICRNGYAWDIGSSIPTSKHLFPIQGRLITEDCSYLLFHKSWEWLMPVVEKIENLSIKYVVSIKDKSCDIHNVFVKDNSINIYINTGTASKLECTYKAVLEFINWYNKNK